MNWNLLMGIALEEAELARDSGDVPVGAVLVDSGGDVLARNHNRREAWQDPTAHAEMLVLREASHRLGSWRLSGSSLIVTLEPCTMCAGALVLSRVSRLVIGAKDPKTGAVNSLYHVVSDDRLNHQIEWFDGVRADEAGKLLKDFFRSRRDK